MKARYDLGQTLLDVCVTGAYAKCNCGATMKTEMDAVMHYCHPRHTGRKKQVVSWDLPWE